VKKSCQFAIIGLLNPMNIFFTALAILISILIGTPSVHAQAGSGIVVKPKTSVSNTYSLPFSSGNTAIDAFLARIFNPPQQIQIPKMDKYALWMENSLQVLLPQAVNEKVIKDTRPRTVSMSYRYCAVNSKTGQRTESTSDAPIITDPDPAINSLVTGAVSLNSLYGRGEKIPESNGSYDFNYAKEIVGKADPCGTDNQGNIQESKRVQTNAQGSTGGGLFSTIFGWFSGATKDTTGDTVVTKTESINGDQYSRAMCSAAGNCTDKDLADLPGKERERLKSGGVMDTFIPQSVKTKETEGKTESTTTDKNLVFQKTMAVKEKSDDARCLIIPQSLHRQYGMNCGGAQSPTCSSTALPDLTLKGGCSTLCNTEKLTQTSDYLTDLEKSALPDGDLPDLAKQIINKAAETFNVPPSLILSTMVSEGSFEWPADWQWTEENVKKWSVCGGKMPACETHAHPVSGSRGAVGWIPSWFFEESDKNYEAVQKVDPSRTKDLVDPCNFMDAIFATAKSMQKTSGGVTYPYTTCWGYPLLMNGGPSTSCAWDDNRVTTAIRQYAGYCTEPGKNGQYPAQTKNNNSFDRAFNFFRSFTCE